MAPRSSPESLTASAVAARHSGTTRETCFRSRASTQASSSNSGISPPMWTSRCEESKREMRFTPDFPASTARQKSSLPVPFGLTTPIPVITTRGGMNKLETHFIRCDNHTDAARIVHFRAFLPHQVHLLQLCLGRVFTACVRKVYRPAVRRNQKRACDCRSFGRSLRDRRRLSLFRWWHPD